MSLHSAVRLWTISLSMFCTLACVVATAQESQSLTPTQYSEFVEEMIEEKIRMTPEQLRELLLHQQNNRQAEEASVSEQGGDPSLQGVVSADLQPESEIHAAINPTDSNNMVVSGMRYGTSLTMPIYYTKDFGQTWNKSTFVTRTNNTSGQIVGGGDPMFAYAADGTLYFSWIYLSLEGSRFDSLPMQMYWAYSTDGGETWKSEANNLIASGYLPLAGGATLKMYDKQWMAVDTTNSEYRGTLYVALLEADGSTTTPDYRIVVRRKRTDETSFKQVSAVVDGGGFQQVQFTSLSVGLTGDIHVTFFGDRGSGPMLWHAVSTDGGENFSAPVMVSKIYVPRFSPGESNSPIVGVQASRIYPCPHVAIDKSNGPNRGALYMVWSAYGVDEKSSSTVDIYFTRSNDNGDSWSPPFVINDDKAPNQGNQFHPSITVNPNGIVSVTWYDQRTIPEENDSPGATRYYIAHSFNGGETFTPNKSVSDMPTSFNTIGSKNNNFGIGEYTQVISTSAYAIPFWADGRSGNGNLDIYTAFVPYYESGSSSVQQVTTVSEKFQVRDLLVSDAAVTLHCTLSESSEVAVALADMQGRTVVSLPGRMLEAGTHQLQCDIAGVPAGTYMVVVSTRFGSTTRMVQIVR